ncbi:MAG: hypothetical protein DRN49_03895 [Thaumarchaeota archaeon]|nr:MAG: hypothetical protein DRN49_03895 [Nitrososphaerota archaeon]
MHPYVSRILLVAVTIALVVSALALWRPWEARRSVDLEYVRAKLRAIAEVLEKGSPATLDVGVPLRVVDDYDSVTLTIERPNEEPIAVKLRISAIVYEDKSLRLPLRVERKGFVEIIENGTTIVVKPLPRVESSVAVEYGRQVHLVAVRLVRITSGSSVVQGKIAITFEELESYTYLRSYDYSGAARILVGGEEVSKVEVSSGTGLRITVSGAVARISSSV